MATTTKPLALNESLNTTENTPRNIADVLADELDGIKQAINSQSGSGNGHIIQNSSGANMPSENTMQFVDAHLSDDSVGGKTKVETFKAVTELEYSSETEDGAYIITDGGGAVIEPASDEYVEVVGDDEKTYGTLLAELWNKVDITKINVNSHINLADAYVYSVSIIQPTFVDFVIDDPTTSSPYLISRRIRLQNSPQFREFNTNGYENKASDVLESGYKITLYYGTNSAVTNLINQAKYTYLQSGESVESALKHIKIFTKDTSNITSDAYDVTINYGETLPINALVLPTIFTGTGNRNNAFVPVVKGKTTTSCIIRLFSIGGTPSNASPTVEVAVIY